MNNVFPSLSTDGFVVDRGLILKKTMEMFFSTFENQSNVFPVRSYKFIVNNFEHGMEVANRIELELGAMYEVYFDTTNIKVDYSLDVDKSIYFYSIGVICYYDGKKYELTKTMTENIVMN